MYFYLKRLIFIKLQRFLINTSINKTSDCRRRTNKLLFIFHETMNHSPLFRHAQTQHSDQSFDLENILLCKANLFTASDLKRIETESDNGLETLKSNDEGPATEAGLETKTCVFFETADNLPTETDDQLPAPIERKEVKLQNPEKRKADDTESPQDLKKAKLNPKTIEIKRPGFSDDRYNETSYYFENGLRKVYPYYFTFTTFTKGRWVGEKILDVFSREFRAHPAEEYERNILNGSLTVNYEKVPIDYILKHNDLLANTVHRHEVPVSNQAITIVHMDDDIVVVNKPASIPVHPCGRYRHNTVVFILAKEYNLINLRTIHRLDRLTSGLLLFGRSPKKARQLETEIRNREVKKEYICRVEGEFPDGIIECNEPILVVSFKIGVCQVSPKGKDCKTTFEKMSYNGTSSVVLCKPLTGRMHQIRVHLQYLGFPIVNDPLYNHVVFGPLKGRGGDIGGRTEEELVRDLINVHNAENWLGIEGDADMSMFRKCDAAAPLQDNLNKTQENSSTASKKSPTEAADSCNQADKTSATSSSIDESTHENALITSQAKANVATQTGHVFPDLAFNVDKMIYDKYCYDCKVRYRDPKPNDLVMYLHAWKYKGAGWEYETMLPDWGSADWVGK